MRHNPYQPPSADLFDPAPKFRTDFGIRLGWSLFWRAFLLQMFAVFAVDSLRFVQMDIFRLKQVVICVTLALVPALSLLATRRGALFFLFGDRIALADAAWRKFHWMLVVFYSVMATWHLMVAFSFVEVAPNIRIAIAPIALLLFFFVIAPRLLRMDTDVE